MQDDLQSLQMQLVQRQMAEPGLALSPALLFGDPTLWGKDPKMLALLRDVACGQGRHTFPVPCSAKIQIFMATMWLHLYKSTSVWFCPNVIVVNETKVGSLETSC